MTLREDANKIIEQSIHAVLPDVAVQRALENYEFGSGKVLLVSIGKAGWQMAKAASDVLGSRIDAGVVVTKYDHVKGELPGIKMVEAGHPVPDENSFAGTDAALELVSGLTADDTVLFLVSGGGSALFESPLVPGDVLQDITSQLLASGAEIQEMNTIRKRLSAVKGGKFAKLCAPAKVYSIILSDIIGDPIDMIASGPAYPDSSTCEDALDIVDRYGLKIDDSVRGLLSVETPKELDNVETVVNGSVRELCAAAATAAEALGYETVVLTDRLCCEASDAGSFLASIAQTHQDTATSLAFIAGGETVVHLKGKGLGGRNQELALAASLGLAETRDTCVFSVGSDGTDGPTDAAGGYTDSETIGTATPSTASGAPASASASAELADAALPLTPGRSLSAREAQAYLANNDAYHALEQTGGLIITGATGTNVNDVAVVLIKR